MKLILHNYWRSSASQRVRIALGLKQLAYDYVSVHLLNDGGQHKSAAYKLLNPMAQVPALEVVEDNSARHVLTQSLPIIEFLDERFPETPRLLPSDPFARAQTRALAEIVNAGIQPFQNLSTTSAVKALGGDDVEWICDFMTKGLAAFEASVAAWRQAHQADGGPYCVGGTPTLADCCLIPQLHAARRFAIDLAPFPQLRSIDAACAALPAFASAAPERQPDAPVPSS